MNPTRIFKFVRIRIYSEIEKQLKGQWAESACGLVAQHRRTVDDHAGRGPLAQCYCGSKPLGLAGLPALGERPTDTRPALEGSPRDNQCVGLTWRRLQTEVDGGLRHDGTSLAHGRRGDDAAQGEGSSPAMSRQRRHGRGRQSALAALGHARLSGNLRGKTEER
jgi:hypothetical protein